MYSTRTLNQKRCCIILGKRLTHNNDDLNTLSERFSDNVIFYGMVSIDPNNKNKIKYLSKFLAEYISKRLIAEYNINTNKRCIMPKYSDKEYEYYKQYIKALITSEKAIKSFNSFNNNFVKSLL